jgi:hypothetical protein
MHTLPFRTRALVFAVIGCGLLFTSTPSLAQSMAPIPTSMSFGAVLVGSNKSQTAWLQNTGKSSLTISRSTISGKGFKLSGLPVPTTLAAGHSITFKVTFAPTATGASSGSLAVTYASSRTTSFALSGSGAAAGKVSMAPTSLNFGSVPVGSTKTVPVKFNVSGFAAVITSITTTNSEFTVTGLTLPKTVPAGQSLVLNVKFAPKSGGTAAGQLTFAGNGSPSRVAWNCSGSGAATASHRADLSWKASSSSVMGYNVYRGSATGGPFGKMNSTPSSATSFKDSSVKGGSTYYYVVTSVNSSGKESAYSNTIKAAVPMP